MLTTEEIKKALDTGNAVGLECVDADMYCRTDSAFKHEREVIARSSLVITSIIGQGDFKALMISDCRYCIPENDLKHFRIKRPAPTFDDLIDVAVRAAKDDVIVIRRFHSSFLDFEEYGTTKHADNVGVSSSSAEDIKDAIDFINSLYTETFMINDLGSLQKVAIDANGVLANGSKFKVIRGHGQYLGKGKLYIEFENEVTNHALLEVLNGATVTQKRGAL